MLDRDESLFFNVKRRKTKDTYFDLENVEWEDKKVSLTLGIDEEYKKFSLSLKKSPVFNVKLTLKCHVEDLQKSEDVGELFTTQDIPEEVLKIAENKIKAIYENMIEKLRVADCDLFGLTDDLYKYHFFKYDKYKDDILQKATLNAEIKCKVERNTRT